MLEGAEVQDLALRGELQECPGKLENLGRASAEEGVLLLPRRRGGRLGLPAVLLEGEREEAVLVVLEAVEGYVLLAQALLLFLDLLLLLLVETEGGCAGPLPVREGLPLGGLLAREARASDVEEHLLAELVLLADDRLVNIVLLDEAVHPVDSLLLLLPFLELALLGSLAAGREVLHRPNPLAVVLLDREVPGVAPELPLDVFTDLSLAQG